MLILAAAAQRGDKHSHDVHQKGNTGPNDLPDKEHAVADELAAEQDDGDGQLL